MSDSLTPYSDGMDGSPPGSSVHEILQARILEWVAMPSRGSSEPRDRTVPSAALALQADSLLVSPWGSPSAPTRPNQMLNLIYLVPT